MEASLHIKSWVHAEADSIHPNSSRITRRMEKRRMNGVSNQTAPLQTRRQKEEAGSDRKKRQVLLRSDCSGNGTQVIPD